MYLMIIYISYQLQNFWGISCKMFAWITFWMFPKLIKFYDYKLAGFNSISWSFTALLFMFMTIYRHNYRL